MSRWWTSLFSVFIIVILNSSFSASRTPGDFSPPRVPLGIRSPYYNAWVSNDPVVPQWPNFWSTGILGWAGFVRIDGVNWVWMGMQSSNISTATGVEITSTRTIYTFQAGPMSLRITYLSPIEAADAVKQSLPFTYVSFEANSTDGRPHSVQVYSDITAEWVSGDRSSVVTWDTTKTSSTTFHRVKLRDPKPLTENQNQAEDVTLYYAMANDPNLSYRIGVSGDCRDQFVTTGSLSGTASTSSGVINNPFVSFAFALDLGTITQTQHPTTVSVGIVRDLVASFPIGSTSRPLYPYFASQYSVIDNVIDSFVADYSSASQRAVALDTKITNAASQISPHYANLVSLAARQTIGGTELTLSNGTDGVWNTSEARMLMKDVGTSSRMNPVEVLYASFPFFLYLNATYGGQLLKPLLESQQYYDQPYAARDLGSAYPQAAGFRNPHSQGIEQSANMLIMSLAHARASGDGSLIYRYYDYLNRWAGYLVYNSLLPTTDQTNDPEQYTNSTNLAIKGIIGIKAMSEISRALGKDNDTQYYLNASTAMSNQWRSFTLASDPDHIPRFYGGTNTSWSIMYNLYADKLLQTNVVSDDIYQLTTSYLKTVLGSNLVSANGIPLSSVAQGQVNAAWTLFTAAIVTDPDVRNSLIERVWTAANNASNYDFASAYGLDAKSSSGISSPAMGAMFSILALGVQSQTITVPSSESSSASQSKKTNVIGPAVGGTIGGLAILGTVVIAVIIWRRRIKNRSSPSQELMREGGFDGQWMSPYNYNPQENAQSNTQLNNQSRPLLSDPPPTNTPPEPVVGSIMSTKAREAMAERYRPVVPSSNVSSDPPASSSPPTEVSYPSAAAGSSSQVDALRAELVEIRRVMQGIQAEAAERFEAPPNYHDIQSQRP